ncbi:hypothetical protein Taro_017395 [Colocasia esculenta]|uniref:Apple domain-containing protein n=1 Tax=Colocasia esculenta TaxID=4460 RepID=A0A843UR87_COLES|nr:hypothetical protein [Colocasia esculenta]
MARGGGWWKWCSYKRTTVVVCCINLVAALYVLRSLYTSFYIFSSSSPGAGGSGFSAAKYSTDQIRRMEESIQLRRAAQPIELVRLVKGLKEELSEKERDLELSQPMKQQLANELLQRLKALKPDANVTEQRVQDHGETDEGVTEALEKWHMEKLEATRKLISKNATRDSTRTQEEAKALKRAIESDWLMLLEEVGLWIPAEVVNKEINDKPENEQEPEEEEIVPGRPIPPQCHAELHTDYGGAAVRWGLTHHKESAADCCQACLDQAKRAKPGEMKCNIWVYCPLESGCYSPDIYEHKHQECWLKQEPKTWKAGASAYLVTNLDSYGLETFGYFKNNKIMLRNAENPKLNFKDKYSESYINSHPTAPLVVPWISGVVG